MTVRALPPAWSPLGFDGVLAAGRTLLFGGAGARRRLVTELGARFPGSMVRPVDSGTTALTVALRLAARTTGRPRVVLPAYACYDLVTAAVGADCAVDFYDVDPAGLCPDWASLRAALGRGPGAVVVAHLFGYPVPADQVAVLARESGALLVDDAAQAIGARVAGRPAGAIGDLGVLSFGRGKGVTGGSGGALLANAEALHALAAAEEIGPPSRGAGDLAALAALWALTHPVLYGVPARMPALGLGETVYREPHAARGLSGPAAAAILAGLSRAAIEIPIRRANAERLSGRLAGGVQPIVPSSWADAACLRLPILASSGAERDALAARGRLLGLARGYPRALPSLPQATARLAADANVACAGAVLLADRLLTAPVHGRVRPAEFEAISRALQP